MAFAKSIEFEYRIEFRTIKHQAVMRKLVVAKQPSILFISYSCVNLCFYYGIDV